MGIGIKVVNPSAGPRGTGTEVRGRKSEVRGRRSEVGGRRRTLDEVRREDEKLNARWAGYLRPDGEGLQCFVDKQAVDHAVATEGPEVMTPAGAGYWEDMKRRYPHLRGGSGRVDGDSANGRRNRHGRVTMKYRQGAWWRMVRGEWVRVERNAE